MKKSLIYIVIGSSMKISYLFACSAPPAPSVTEAFQESTSVYLATAESITNTPISKKTKVEHQKVIFRVLEAWKGTKKVGDTVIFDTDIYRGGCGVSVNNTPPWLKNESPDPKTGKHESVKMSGIWLIYEESDEQNSLTNIGRTAPFEYGGVDDLKELYSLSDAKSAAKKNEGVINSDVNKSNIQPIIHEAMHETN